MTLDLLTAELSEEQFEHISEMTRELCGINLHTGKKELVKARLCKRLRQLGLRDFSQYIEYIRGAGAQEEIRLMLDALSTNLTFFFREPQHFAYLRSHVLPEAMRRRGNEKRLRIWSAGCSSGEEPYTVAMVVRDELAGSAGWDARILATDLSTKVLAIARRAVYDAGRLRETPPDVVSRHLESSGGHYCVRKPIRDMVTFARLNLMEPWPMKGPFDVIFCRNVMIYFDKPTQAALVERFFGALAPGGALFIGHSESLAGVRHSFEYVQPTVYRKPQ